jgi:hypothetical protein
MTRTQPRWSALGWGALIALVAYWAIVLGFVVPEYDGGGIHLSDEVTAGGPLLVGLLLVPVTLVAITLVSGRDHTLRAIAAATATAGVVGVAVAVVATTPAGVVAGIGAGTILAMPGGASSRYRWWYLAAAVTISLVIHLLEPQLSLFVSGVLPVVAIGVADAAADSS